MTRRQAERTFVAVTVALCAAVLLFVFWQIAYTLGERDGALRMYEYCSRVD